MALRAESTVGYIRARAEGAEDNASRKRIGEVLDTQVALRRSADFWAAHHECQSLVGRPPKEGVCMGNVAR